MVFRCLLAAHSDRIAQGFHLIPFYRLIAALKTALCIIASPYRNCNRQNGIPAPYVPHPA